MEGPNNGWGPGVPVDDTLLRRFILGTAERGRYLAGRTGGWVHDDDEVSCADLGSPVPFDNVAVLLQPPSVVDVQAVVRRAQGFYGPTRTWLLFSAWPLPDLSDTGLHLMGHPPFMARPPAALDDDAGTSGLTIEAVTGPDRLTTFVRTLADAYPMPGCERSPLARPESLGDPLALFLGEVDGTPVATSGAWLSDGLVDVNWISCQPQVRGRGVGRAMTAAAVAARPADPAVLIASDDGFGVYRALGFEPLLRLTLWFQPGAG